MLYTDCLHPEDILNRRENKNDKNNKIKIKDK